VATVDSAVDAALADGSIIRTHILRPTWHFVLPADIRWMMQLTAPGILARFGSAPGGRGWPFEGALERGYDVFRSSLAGGARMTRVELAAQLVERGVVGTREDTIPFFMRGELDMVLVSGGLRGRMQSYALASERVPLGATFDRDTAVVELTRRYFTSHGPATISDFGWWSSLNVGDIRAGLATLAATGELERVDIDGTDYWWGGDRFVATARDDSSPTVQLMQAYDEYIVAHRAPRTPINVSGSPEVGSGMSRPPFLHAVILDGQLVGWWRRTLGDAAVTVEVKLAVTLDRAQGLALDEAATRYGEFLGLPATLEIR
jgi:hypothetical protein